MSLPRAILDYPGDPGRDRRLLFEAPRDVIEARCVDAVRPALRRAEQAARAGAYVVGFVAYEAAPAFDRALVTREPDGRTPLVWFGIFDAPMESEPPLSASDDVALEWMPDTARADYDTAVARIRESIAAGDVYQVNHTLRFASDAAGFDVRTWYDARVARRHGRYHALIETADWSIACVSPELFLDCRDRVISTRPMKGTERRGRWPGEDDAAAARLSASPKDRAENLMIVDLLRNDLGRIAEFGSVRVPRLCDVETYPSVHQLTSTVTARLRDDVSLDDVFAATFPCGSVTGAPKIAAMHAIARHETSPRGPYCGAIGLLRPDGSFTFNVAIRTLVLDAHHAVYGAGGGITWDSRADAEYDEVLSKAGLLETAAPRFELLETLRLDDGVYPRLPLHLERLARSARYWGFSPETERAAATALRDEALAAGAGAWRVRLTAAPDGAVAIRRTRLEDAPPSRPPFRPRAQPPLTVRLALRPVSRRDRLLFHKTTARAVYESRRADFADEPEPPFDVLLWNDEGEVTEFTNGNVVVQIGGERVTPPLECGLLAGTLRAELLAAGRIVERVVTVEQFRRADEIWLTNSVHGCVRVTAG